MIDNSKDKGKRFMSVEQIIALNKTWKISKAVRMKKDSKGSKYVQFRSSVDDVATPSTEITVSAALPTSGKYDEVAFSTVASEGKNSISVDCFVETLFRASKKGATHLFALNEGITKKLEMLSWGIGFNYGKATETSMGTGGTGVSGGSSGTGKYPYHQFVAAVEVESKTAKTQTKTQMDILNKQ